MQKVWHRRFDGYWYATLREQGQRKQIKLVKAPDTRVGRKLAEKQLVQELADREAQDQVANAPSWITVAHILDAFLLHSQEEHDHNTFTWYKNFLDGFNSMYGNLRYTCLRKTHVKAWVKAKGYNPTSQNRGIGALKRAFNWAVEEEHIAKSPIAHLRKPKGLVRDRVLTLEERQLILSSPGVGPAKWPRSQGRMSILNAAFGFSRNTSPSKRRGSLASFIFVQKPSN